MFFVVVVCVESYPLYMFMNEKDAIDNIFMILWKMNE